MAHATHPPPEFPPKLWRSSQLRLMERSAPVQPGRQPELEGETVGRPVWAGLGSDYRRSRRELKTISPKSAHNLLYVLSDLCGWLDGAPTTGPLRRGPVPRAVHPHADAAEIAQAIEAW